MSSVFSIHQAVWFLFIHKSNGGRVIKASSITCRGRPVNGSEVWPSAKNICPPIRNRGKRIARSHNVQSPDLSIVGNWFEFQINEHDLYVKWLPQEMDLCQTGSDPVNSHNLAWWFEIISNGSSRSRIRFVLVFIQSEALWFSPLWQIDDKILQLISGYVFCRNEWFDGVNEISLKSQWVILTNRFV
jgi:hypothetical protein